MLNIQCATSFVTASDGKVVERSTGVQEVVGSVPGWVIPKTSKMKLDAFLLCAQQLKVRPRKYGRFLRC